MQSILKFSAKRNIQICLIGLFVLIGLQGKAVVNECGNDVNAQNMGSGFNGFYTPANWTTQLNDGTGTVNVTGASIVIQGNNNSEGGVFTTASTIAVSGGQFTFNWSWITNDSPAFDPAFYINGSLVTLTNSSSNSQSGTVTITVAEGATIGFGINSTDGCCGFATLTITSFQWPGNCPLNECGNFVNAGGFGNGFTGYYAPGEWTTNLDGGNGSVSLPTPLSVQVLGNNNLISGSQTSFTSTAVVAGTISFNWSWTTADSPGFDPAFFTLNGIQTNLTNTSSVSQSGTFSIVVAAGSTFGFGVDATDGCCGRGTLLISNFTWPGTCIPGCMDPAACNYNPVATSDDGSCIASGCIDPTALNYDPNVVCDNGSCVFGLPNDVCGGAEFLNLVTDELFSFIRNTNTASTDGGAGSCGIPAVITGDRWFSFVANGGPITLQGFGLFGQTLGPAFALFEECYSDPIACAAQGIGNGTGSASFIFLGCGELLAGQTYYLQVGGGELVPQLFFRMEITQRSPNEGCTTLGACNFDPEADCDNGTCLFLPAACNDPAACNYIPNCNADPTMCIYTDCNGICGGQSYLDDCGNCVTPGVEKNEQVFFFNGIEQTFTVPPIVTVLEVECKGAKGGEVSFVEFNLFNEIVIIGSTNIAGEGGRATGFLPVQPGQVIFINVGGSGDNGGFNGGGLGSTTYNSDSGNGGGASDVRFVSGDLFSRRIVAGGGGGSYRIVDFGSEEAGYTGGGNGGGLNGQTANSSIGGGSQTAGGAGFPDGSFGQGANSSNITDGGGGGGGWYGGGSNFGGAGGSGYIGRVINGTMQTGVNNTDGLVIIRWPEFQDVPCKFGCTNPVALNFDPTTTNDDGSCMIGGCIDPIATNFNPAANFGDNSCLYFQGCTYTDATNFDSAAIKDDGSCVFNIVNTCPADLNNDGLVGITDLLVFVSAYGSVCP